MPSFGIGHKVLRNRIDKWQVAICKSSLVVVKVCTALIVERSCVEGRAMKRYCGRNKAYVDAAVNVAI
jgi:hypothetical protein